MIADAVLLQALGVVAFVAAAVWGIVLMFPRTDDRGKEHPRTSLLLVSSHLCVAALGAEVTLLVLLLANHVSWR